MSKKIETIKMWAWEIKQPPNDKWVLCRWGLTERTRGLLLAGEKPGHNSRAVRVRLIREKDYQHKNRNNAYVRTIPHDK